MKRTRFFTCHSGTKEITRLWHRMGHDSKYNQDNCSFSYEFSVQFPCSIRTETDKNHNIHFRKNDRRTGRKEDAEHSYTRVATLWLHDVTFLNSYDIKNVSVVSFSSCLVLCQMISVHLFGTCTCVSTDCILCQILKMRKIKILKSSQVTHTATFHRVNI